MQFVCLLCLRAWRLPGWLPSCRERIASTSLLSCRLLQLDLRLCLETLDLHCHRIAARNSGSLHEAQGPIPTPVYRGDFLEVLGLGCLKVRGLSCCSVSDALVGLPASSDSDSPAGKSLIDQPKCRLLLLVSSCFVAASCSPD